MKFKLENKIFFLNSSPKAIVHFVQLSTRSKSGMARHIFGTVLTIFRHGTPNFRRVNVAVPNEMWHQCPKCLECRDYLQEVVSARVISRHRAEIYVRVNALPCRSRPFCLKNPSLAHA